MHYHVLTLFPEMIEQGMGTSIMGRAMEQGLIRLTATNIRDFSTNKHMKVDDYPYGGGAGMVMQAEPVYGAWKQVTESIGYKPRVIYLTPQGKVFPTTDDPDRFRKLKQVILDTGREQKSLEIEGVKFFKQFVILKFKDIDNINDIEKYKGKSLYVTREHAVKLKKDEYFIADLIDMQVELEDGTAFGVLTDVMQTGANDVYCIRTEEHGEVLIPAIKDCILDVDVEAGKMKIHLMDGLI